MNEIFVVGHRNPDTDSIVASMAYAALRNALGDREYVAGRLGQVSDETRRMLDRFHFNSPKFIKNVRTQVQDLDFDTPPALDPSVTMDRAWRIMREQRISVIPVANPDGTLYGTLSAGDIATYSMNTISESHVDEVPLFNLISVLEGRILNDGNMSEALSGNLTIALPQGSDELQFHSTDTIVLCGSQPEVIRKALDAGVNAIILCRCEVDSKWLENAGNTCVISTPFDASRVSRLIYQATPISRPCNTEDLVCFHLDDYIDDVKEVVLKSRFRCYPVLDENEHVVGTLSRYHLLRPRRKRVVLVDADLQFGDVGVFMNLPRRDTISDLVSESNLNASTVNSFLVRHRSGVDVLCAPVSPELAELVKSEHIERIVTVLRSEYDYVILDTAPLLDDINLTALEQSDTIYFVTTPEIPTLKNTRICIGILRTLNYADRIRLVLNREGDPYVKRRDVKVSLELEPVLCIPNDSRHASGAVNRGIPVVTASPRSRISKAITRFVEKGGV